MVSPPHPWIHGRRSDHLRGINKNFQQQKTCFLLLKMNSVFLCAAIHSAIRVFTGEADEITALSSCGFCVKLFNYKMTSQ